MNRFRIQDNVPQVYVAESRDFQMLCNVFDLMNNGVKFDIDTIKSLSDSIRCPERLIKYLQHKLGFYSNVKMSDDTLRTILKCFPYLVKLKGSRRGVVESICVFLTTLGINGKQKIEVNNHNTNDGPCGNYVIVLNIEHKSLDVTILKEILRYILPTGYIVKYSFFQSVDLLPTITENSDIVNITFVDANLGSGVKLSPDDGTQYKNDVISSISSSTIIDVKHEVGIKVDTKNVVSRESVDKTIKVDVALLADDRMEEEQ